MDNDNKFYTVTYVKIDLLFAPGNYRKKLIDHKLNIKNMYHVSEQERNAFVDTDCNIYTHKNHEIIFRRSCLREAIRDFSFTGKSRSTKIKFKSVKFGYNGYIIYLDFHGTLYSGGYNETGALGTNDIHQLDPVKISIPEKVISVKSGKYHVVALTKSHNVYVWGDNSRNQLGLEELTYSTPQKLNVKNVKSIHCGSYHTVLFFGDKVKFYGKTVGPYWLPF